MTTRSHTAQEEISQKQFFLKGVIDRIEEEKVIIELEQGQTIEWPKSKILEDATEGASIRLVLSTSKTDEEERERVAKSLLNEILHTNER